MINIQIYLFINNSKHLVVRFTYIRSCSHNRSKTNSCLDLTTMSYPYMIARLKVLESDVFAKSKMFEHKIIVKLKAFGS